MSILFLGGYIMKKSVKNCILSSLLIGASLLSPSASFAELIDVAKNPVTVYVDGQTVNADNFILNGTTYVPLRAVSESLGAEVLYDGSTSTVQINNSYNGYIGTYLNAARNTYSINETITLKASQLMDNFLLVIFVPIMEV